MNISEQNASKAIPPNKIAEVVSLKLPADFECKPKKTFYQKVGINQKRWGQLIRGTAEPMASELKAIADYFKVAVTDLINI